MTMNVSTVEVGHSSLERAESLLEAGKLEEAIAMLETLGERGALGLLGAAYFRQEEYAKAADVLERALVERPSDKGYRELLERARANVTAEVKNPVPRPVFFDRKNVPAAPEPVPNAAGQGLAEYPKTLLSRAAIVVGSLAGKKFGEVLGVLTQVLGREKRSGSPWTSWYHDENSLRAIVMLARRRWRLNREQLFGAYPPNVKTGFYNGPAAPPGGAGAARTADGGWNDLSDPMAGAARTRFGFNTDPTQTEAETGVRLMTPNPRQVSRVLLTRKSGLKEIPFLNLVGATWIQFMNHDWVSYGDPADAPPYRIPLAEDDPVRRTLKQTHMLVRPTQTDPTRRAGEKVPTHINEVTSWWDGSQIYGSDSATLDSLRTHQGGKLEIDPVTGHLPVLGDGVEKTGFRRNWWLGLSMLHLLFVKEHNAICELLSVRYPHFDDQRLFDIARLVNAAVMAKIHTVEWTPAVLANGTLHSAMNTNWYGALTNLFRTKQTRRTLAEINVADPIAGGLVGNASDNFGVAYSLTREFLSVYRLHSLLPDKVSLYPVHGSGKAERTWALPELRQAGAHKVTAAVSMVDLFHSFGRQNAGQLVLNNYPESLQNLSIPGAGFYDLGAVDVLRDRERGVPRYNHFRRLMGLKPITCFEQLTDDPEALRALKQVYESIEDIDLLIGNLAESHRPTGFGFGETLFEIFILNASRRLQADRFFTESYREDVYTPEGLAWIDQASLKTVLLRHYPELSATGLANVENAFEPWDEGVLAPERHPLRAFDSDLRKSDEKARFQANAEAMPRAN
jgi:tetratricopeptide (TPR) repeat protein